MTDQRVAIVAGARTPFVKASQTFAPLGPLALGKHAVRGLLERHEVDPAGIGAIAFGVVVAEPGKPNLAREIVLETGLPAGRGVGGGFRGSRSPGHIAGVSSLLR